jgi:MoxR-like ATPase
MTIAELYESTTAETGRVISGQEDVLRQLFVCFLAGGHALLEGVPGVAKTLMARTLSQTLGCEFKRIQFTPDLMPSDVVGTNIYDQATGQFRLREGPVFTHVLLADEINRTPPKTQAALLEAMEEHRVTIDGTGHPLEEPFFVVATQNPVEFEGTYPLPEAQLDRFLMKILVRYPDEADEVAVLRRAHAGFEPRLLDQAGVRCVITSEALRTARAEAQEVRVDDGMFTYICQVVRQTRTAYGVELGASPRAGLALLRCGKVAAAIEGRNYLTPDDVKPLAPAILRHRILLRAEAEVEGLTAERVAEAVINQVPVPR